MSWVKVVGVGVLVGIGGWMVLGAMILADDWPGLFLNLGAEIMGAGLIYLVFDWFIGSRERREAAEREMEAHKKDLIARMGSRERAVAIAAAEELRTRGRLNDGSLQRALLPFANLQRAFLVAANLRGADLMGANLKGAFLGTANLERANLRGAYLQSASLGRANLQGADLIYADLEGTGLQGANLQGADLEYARFDETTTLPDDTKWISDTDMVRFTNPNHPEFWRSDDPRSPAYAPKEQE